MTENDNSWPREDDSWRKTTSHAGGRSVFALASFAEQAGPDYLVRSGFKTPSEDQWLRCRPPINAHILNVCCAFSIGLRLDLEPDLRF